MQINWVDILIFVVIGYQSYIGWSRGSLSLLANLGSFLGSLWMAIRFHGAVGDFLGEKFGVSAPWVDGIGYLVVAIVTQFIFEALLLYVVNLLPKKYLASKINHWLGSMLSVANSVILLSFFILLILALPLRGSLKQDVKKSHIAQFLALLSERYGGDMRDSVKDLANKATKFFTVEPNSSQSVSLDIPAQGMVYTIDSESENQMITLVNRERLSLSISPLVLDVSITNVAREKSLDMFKRRYFSHYDPDGKNAVDRMDKANVIYKIVGENLAFAPDILSAHSGLMDSEGHRKNILDERFGRIGIGVMDGGVYGKMFTQIFAD